MAVLSATRHGVWVTRHPTALTVPIHQSSHHTQLSTHVEWLESLFRHSSRRLRHMLYVWYLFSDMQHLLICATLIGICGVTSLQSWSTTCEHYWYVLVGLIFNAKARWGLCECNRNAGYCRSCCNDSFNDDNFDEVFRRDMQETRVANTDVIVQQPTESNVMTLGANKDEN